MGGWGYGYGFGGRGDDTFILPDEFVTANYDGGLGSDPFTAMAESEALDNLTEGDMTLSGGEGNDRIEGPHLSMASTLNGNAGSDKIIGGN